MRLSFSHRIYLIVAAFGALLATVFLASTLFLHGNEYREILQSDAMLQAKQVAAQYPQLTQVARLNPDAAAELLASMPFDARTDIYVLDADGKVLASETPLPQGAERLHIDMRDVESLVTTGTFGHLDGADPKSPGRRCLAAAARLLSDNPSSKAYLYLILNTADAQSRELTRAKTVAVRISIVLAAATTVIGVLLAMWLLSRTTQPVRALCAAVDSIDEHGVADAQSLRTLRNQSWPDDLGRLAEAIETMLEKIHGQVARIRHMDRLRREMLLGISHDLRSPLTALIGSLELALSGTSRMPSMQSTALLDSALTNARHIDQLTASLFVLSRLDAQGYTPCVEPAALGELLDDIRCRFARIALDRRITLKTIYPNALPLVRCDVQLIERAIANLLDNALRHTPADGNVKLCVDVVADMCLLSVIDTGIGIPADALVQLFDAFFQVETAREGGSHTGLGLAIVKQIAELHDGRTWVKSEIGEGAGFYIEIPVAGPRKRETKTQP